MARLGGHTSGTAGKLWVVDTDWRRVSDDELLRLARREPAAFAAFYSRHERLVLGFFVGRVGDAEVAADLVAETFAAALSAIPRFRRRREPPTAWLLGIARNILAMSSRRGRVEARARRRLGMPQLTLTDEALERIEGLDATALELLGGLPPRAREAVKARVVDERDYPDIARDLRCSEAVVRKRVSRGLASLRDQMEEPT
jgi:RNA polymerase sigma factor (sigma-70 family)